MTDQTISPPKRIIALVPTSTRGRIIALLAIALIYGVVAAMILRSYPSLYRGFGFNPAPLLNASPAIQAHVAAALATFSLGLAMFVLPKGRGLHKPMGWLWVVLMATTAGSSFFITGLMGKSYSPIHMLSGWTLIVLPLAIMAIRRKQVMTHRARMEGLFFGAMLIAGLFTFLPGRLMWNLFFGG